MTYAEAVTILRSRYRPGQLMAVPRAVFEAYKSEVPTVDRLGPVPAKERRRGLMFRDAEVIPDDDIYRSPDPRLWAEAFVGYIIANPAIASDVDCMTTWFASAMMRGYDDARQTAPTTGDGVVALEATPEQSPCPSTSPPERGSLGRS